MPPFNSKQSFILRLAHIVAFDEIRGVPGASRVTLDPMEGNGAIIRRRATEIAPAVSIVVWGERARRLVQWWPRTDTGRQRAVGIRRVCAAADGAEAVIEMADRADEIVDHYRGARLREADLVRAVLSSPICGLGEGWLDGARYPFMSPREGATPRAEAWDSVAGLHRALDQLEADIVQVCGFRFDDLPL